MQRLVMLLVLAHGMIGEVRAQQTKSVDWADCTSPYEVIHSTLTPVAICPDLE